MGASGISVLTITADPLWGAPPELIEAWRDEIHIWRVFLNIAPSWVQSLSNVLSTDERERAERLRFQRDRQDFIVTRALLRILVGRYLRREPDQVQFSYGTYGKPSLAGESDQALRFNLSHSQGLALYAITRGRQIGIDVECMRENQDTEAIAQRFFSSQEIAAIESLPEPIKQKAFFACWTRKEAYLKARGDGLSGAMDSFSVSVNPGEPAVFLNVKNDPHENSRWSLIELDPGPRYAGALAVEGHDWRLRCWQLTGNMQDLPTSNQCMLPGGPHL